MQVIKRDGTIAPFHTDKIAKAVSKAFDACQKPYNDEIIGLIVLRVTSDFSPKMKNGQIGVEDIQDSVEKVLSAAGYSDVSKAYILYRKQRENVRNIETTTLDYKNIVDHYLETLDNDHHEQASSVGGLILSNSAAITANYWLYEVYDDEIAKAHRNRDFYIHDLHMLTGYGSGWSLLQLIQNGLYGIDGKRFSAPAKHLRVLCNQMVDFLGIMQNEWAGAQSLCSFDTYLAPYVKKEQLSYEEVKQAIQSFVYGVNTPTRWGTQSPYSAITMDVIVPNDLKEQNCYVGKDKQEFTYAEVQEEMDRINRAFIEVMLEKDASGTPFPYPVPTYLVTKEFPWESENAHLLFELCASQRNVHFANGILGPIQPEDSRAIQTEKTFDPNILKRKAGGYIGSGESTGSIGEVTINLPRIAYLAENEEDFFERLDYVLDLAARSLKTKRSVLTQLMHTGLYPFSASYGTDLSHYYSTIGIVGMNEVGQNLKWIREDICQEKAYAFAQKIFQHIQQKLIAYQKQYGNRFELEAPCSLHASEQFAQSDSQRYPDIITAIQNGKPCYTNSSYCTSKDDIFTKADRQQGLQKYYTGGTIMPIDVEKGVTSQTLKNLLQVMLQHYTLPYFCLTKE